MGRLNRKLNLNVLSEEETNQIRESHVSHSMNEMKGAIKQLNVETNVQRPERPQIELTPRYQGGELAEVAREVYRENINPVKAEYQDEGPDTHARRVEKRSIQRAIMGLRNGGDEGKTSLVGPNGSGNVGKYSPSAESGSGNATNNSDNYYALTTDMTLEEYEGYIQEKFSGKKEKDRKDAMPEGDVGHDIHKRAVDQYNKQNPSKKVNEDAVEDLKSELMKMEDTSWQAIDKVMRQIAKDNDMTPKELHKEFKAQNDGQIPDEWIKEHREIEMAGFIPLQELARLNPAGVIYTVTYMYRGGTQRRKFLVPHMEPPSKEEMEEYVRGFWPFARVLAYYPDPVDNQQNNNSMVAVPPVSEKYYFYTPEDWVTLSEEEVEIYNAICEEEGEPITSPEQQEDGTYLLLVADHDTGEQKYITFGEGKQPEAGDSERKLAKAGAERQNAVAKLMQDKEMQKRMDDAIAKSVERDKKRGRVAGIPDFYKKEEVEIDEAAPFVAAAAGKIAGKLAGKGIAKATAGQAAKGGLRKKAADYGTRKGAEMAQNKVTDMLSNKEEVTEEKDKKGKGSGKKDACYNKVKARYDVWPSAYASGALVKCRQKGAKNWGNSKKD